MLGGKKENLRTGIKKLLYMKKEPRSTDSSPVGFKKCIKSVNYLFFKDPGKTKLILLNIFHDFLLSLHRER